MQDVLLTYSNSSTVSMSDLLCLTLTDSLTSLKTMFRTAAANDLLTIIRDPDFDAHLSNVQVKNIACCEKIADCIVKK